ncbi:3-ketoacyl-ACP reductase [Marinomonas mediterranea]|jgi:Dehydrogenases with different specificities (related to short-chain alcohol dehydrogenases)|uniref:3-oxoacyl-(Acyl-carrier-protein) reductase n=1 Tax=Marinomonas mediterranea (strain ATCC 700492 / JCM 21426 / NBRC 103028 / MMB-1) TaxID=717774 RepID=F2JZR0_MARM1|nr:3-ketoacyl-ACP reductase [Marinomonas mediterranea]ADZ90914.1 3-oxoacyl-(acyl-carrier-protein) reductase [Marinomonas mediterranea MMB-1]WCN17059.1 3-ketoacyl-ACP reductase [Marinomonas mediterranea MMB-1]
MKRNAIVTGGAQGIGFDIATELVRNGFQVAILDVKDTSDLSLELKKRLSERNGSYRYYSLDISQIDKHVEVIDSIERDLGSIHCLINNAGIAARPLTDVLDLSQELFDKSIDVNLRGTFFLTQYVAKKMCQYSIGSEKYHSIIFITSIAADMVNTERSQYCITKSALSMTAKVFSHRLAKESIFVHEIRPGFIKTEMTASTGRNTVDEFIEDGHLPISRWGLSEDVGVVSTQLALGKFPYMTGNVFWVDGGLHLQNVP